MYELSDNTTMTITFDMTKYTCTYIILLKEQQKSSETLLLMHLL